MCGRPLFAAERTRRRRSLRNSRGMLVHEVAVEMAEARQFDQRRRCASETRYQRIFREVQDDAPRDARACSVLHVCALHRCCSPADDTDRVVDGARVDASFRQCRCLGAPRRERTGGAGVAIGGFLHNDFAKSYRPVRRPGVVFTSPSRTKVQRSRQHFLVLALL
jgi:hypothetical protein